jgi:uncharacterized protein YjbI with pentapeptide repeats
LEGAHLERALLEHSCLDGAHLAGAFFNDAALNGASFAGAYLWGADLRITKFLRSRPKQKLAILHQTNFREATISKARLDGNRFSCTSFKRADLSAADLRGTTVEWGLDLTGALLLCAHLEGASLGAATFEPSAQRLFWDTNSKLPPALTPVPARNDCDISERMYVH